MEPGDMVRSDLDEAATLYVEVFNAEPWRDEWSVRSARQRLADILDTPGYAGVRLREDASDRLLGFAVGHAEQWFVGRHFYLKEMCVRTDQQRSGHGSALLANLEIRLSDAEQIFLMTAAHGPAWAFYESQGYRAVPRHGVMVKTLAHLVEGE